MTFETTYRYLAPRLERMAYHLRDLVGEGVVEENYYPGTDVAGFDLCIGEDRKLGALYVQINLVDAVEYESKVPDRRGNVALLAAGIGGETIAHICPYNFTKDVWVPLAPRGWPELERRLDMIEESFPDLAEVIKAELAAYRDRERD